MMDFVCNFPFFSVVLCLFAAVLCSVLKAKAARAVTLAVEAVLIFFSVSVLVYTTELGTYFTYDMGHFDSPWSNQLRAGVLEGVMATVFSLVLLLSHIGGLRYIDVDISEKRRNLYCTLLNLVGAALMALTYTNDIFTGYVFLEILTLSSCGILVIRRSGRTALAATRYMVLNLLGSGLFLMGSSLFYGITGHLLMEYIGQGVAELEASGQYALPLTATVGIISAGLAIKSGLFPFHTWMPDTYGCATPASSSILSGIISKGYIFLLIKILYRVVGIGSDTYDSARHILLILGLFGMIFGSVYAMNCRHLNRMVAYSSAAQIGYIFVGIGLGGTSGFVAAIFGMIVHSITKPLLFISGARLSEVSGDSQAFRNLQGSAGRNKMAGYAFAVGAMSMTGIPSLAGFSSKLYYAIAATFHSGAVELVVLAALAVSTLLNALYFVRTVIRIFTPSGMADKFAEVAYFYDEDELPRRDAGLLIAFVCFGALIIYLGFNAQSLAIALYTGVSMLA